MVAIVTDPLKQLVADLVKINDSDASNQYYAAIGRSEQWNATDTPPTPQRSLAEEIDFRNSTQSIGYWPMLVSPDNIIASAPS